MFLGQDLEELKRTKYKINGTATTAIIEIRSGAAKARTAPEYCRRLLVVPVYARIRRYGISLISAAHYEYSTVKTHWIHRLYLLI